MIHRDLSVCSLLWRQTARKRERERESYSDRIIESLCAIRRVSLSGTLFESFIREKKKEDEVGEDTVYNIIF